VQLGLRAIVQHLDYCVVRARAYGTLPLLAEDLQIADDVTQIAWREHRCLLEREGAIVDHRLAVAVDQPDRQAFVGILARDDDIEGVLREHLDPVGEPLLVERRGIGGVELIHLVVKQQRVEGGMPRRGRGGIEHWGGAREGPISWRQCLYIARMADSEMSVSEVPVSCAGSSLTRCRLSGTRRMPSCTNFMASLSSSPRNPAGPIRLPCRRRWRVIASSSPSKPNMVHFMTNSCGPVGTICRIPSVFISRCTIRFGQIVAMVTDQGLSNSCTKSMKRGSRSVIPSLYARISFLASVETFLASDLADAITPC